MILRHSLLYLRIVLFLALTGCLAVTNASPEGPSLSINDMMKVEGFGAAIADPDGSWFIYEKLRPYEDSDDFSFRTYAFQKSGHQLWKVDVASGLVEPLPGVDPAPHSYLLRASPTGRYVLLMQYRYGLLKIGAYDTKQEELKLFNRTPAFDRTGNHNPAWISDREFLYAALPVGDLPLATSVRADVGQTMAAAHWDAWRGNKETAVEVHTATKNEPVAQEDGKLLIANAATGGTNALANGLFADIRVCQRGRVAAALAVSERRPADLNRPVEGDRRIYTLKVFDIATGRGKDLASHLHFFPYTIAWSPDCDKIAGFGWPARSRPQDGRFFVVDLDSNEVTRYDHTGLDLTSERERGWLQRPERVMFLGDQLAVFARRIPSDEVQTPRFTRRDAFEAVPARADWYALSSNGNPEILTGDLEDVSAVPVHAGDDQITISTHSAVYRIYADGRREQLTPNYAGKLQMLSKGTFATRASVVRPEFSNQALFALDLGDSTKIILMDLRETSKGVSVSAELKGDQASPIAASLGNGSILIRSENGPTSRLLLTSESDPARQKQIDTINAHLAAVNFGTWKQISYQVDDPEGKLPARPVTGCILLPPNFNPSQPPPTIVDVYPDVHPSCDGLQPRIAYPDPHSPYLWAGRGFVYAKFSTPIELIRTEQGPIAGIAEVIDDGVNAAIQRGYIDPKRMALFGYSQGGITALFIASQSTRYKAIIASNSWADLYSHYFGSAGVFSAVNMEMLATQFGRYDSVRGSDFGIGKVPFDDPISYVKNSPVFLAPKITAPVLLFHSDMDIFPSYQFDEMYGALARAGREASYVKYIGEGHGPSSPANIRDMWARMQQFLLQNGLAPACADDEPNCPSRSAPASTEVHRLNQASIE